MPPGGRAPLTFIEPMAATSVAELPRGAQWSYEIKLDGYRVLVLKLGADVRLLSRRNTDLTRDFPSVATAVSSIQAITCILDGEIVAVDEDGIPRFQMLQLSLPRYARTVPASRPPIEHCPFANLPMGKHRGWNEGRQRARHEDDDVVAPELVVQIAFVDY